MGITYVKSDVVNLAAPGSGVSVIDLGLAIDEAARVLYATLSFEVMSAWAAGDMPEIKAAISFDPEDTEIVESDDEQFCYGVSGVFTLGATGGQQRTQNYAFDYSGFNLITSRNLVLIGEGTVVATRVTSRVFYEKYKPAAQELVQLIAQRR